jgi:hypothetical protein
MTTSLTETVDNKKAIALQYLGISSRKLLEARGDYDESLNQIRTMRHYIDLAREYGCSANEIEFALGFNKTKLDLIEGDE